MSVEIEANWRGAAVAAVYAVTVPVVAGLVVASFVLGCGVAWTVIKWSFRVCGLTAD